MLDCAKEAKNDATWHFASLHVLRTGGFSGTFLGGMQISPREQGSQYPLPGDFGWLPRQTGGLDVSQLVLVCCNLPRNFSGLTSNPNLGSTGNWQSLCTTRVALTSSFITKSWGMLIVSEFFTFRS